MPVCVNMKHFVSPKFAVSPGSAIVSSATLCPGTTLCDAGITNCTIWPCVMFVVMGMYMKPDVITVAAGVAGQVTAWTVEGSASLPTGGASIIGLSVVVAAACGEREEHEGEALHGATLSLNLRGTCDGAPTTSLMVLGLFRGSMVLGLFRGSMVLGLVRGDLAAASARASSSTAPRRARSASDRRPGRR